MNLKNMIVGLVLGATGSMAAQKPFNENFADSTLRVNYVFSGHAGNVSVSLSSQAKSAGWAGRRGNLDHAFTPSNGSIRVIDPESGSVIYENSFSSLFHEWLVTEEARETSRAFENVFLVPLPRREARIELTLLNNRHEPMAHNVHTYSPADELVATPAPSEFERVVIHQGGDPGEAIDVAIVPEGYTSAERDSFISHARKYAEEILRYEPFASNRERFNFVAVMVPSADSGVSVPLEGKWLHTPFGSHYSTFHSARYLTSPRIFALHDALCGVPYEHVIMLANTERYGGGGIFNSYTIAAARNEKSLPVTVHEFGHSFGGLADEYFYTEEEDESFPLDVEPCEPNITTLVDFASKWEDMTGSDGVGLFEGGGYRSKGIFRPVETCRMRDNFHPEFCPVCRRAISRIIDFYVAQ